MSEDWWSKRKNQSIHRQCKTFDDAIDALVGVRDIIQNPIGLKLQTYVNALLTEENTIQGWIDVCCEILEAMENE